MYSLVIEASSTSIALTSVTDQVVFSTSLNNEACFDIPYVNVQNDSAPDGERRACMFSKFPRGPIGQLWIMTLADGKSMALSSGDEGSGNPGRSPTENGSHIPAGRPA